VSEGGREGGREGGGGGGGGGRGADTELKTKPHTSMWGTRWVERNSNVYIVTRGYEQAKCGFHEPKCGKTNMLWVFMCVWCFMSSNMRFGSSPAPQGFFIVGPSPIPKTTG